MERDGMGWDVSPCLAPPLAPRSILWKLLGMSKASCVSQGCGIWDSSRPPWSAEQGAGQNGIPLVGCTPSLLLRGWGGFCTFSCVGEIELIHFSAPGMSLW